MCRTAKCLVLLALQPFSPRQSLFKAWKGSCHWSAFCPYSKTDRLKIYTLVLLYGPKQVANMIRLAVEKHTKAVSVYMNDHFKLFTGVHWSVSLS